MGNLLVVDKQSDGLWINQDIIGNDHTGRSSAEGSVQFPDKKDAHCAISIFLDDVVWKSGEPISV
eukprot:scaffold313990_cov54-Attheya_sp.AAC.2